MTHEVVEIELLPLFFKSEVLVSIATSPVQQSSIQERRRRVLDSMQIHAELNEEKASESLIFFSRHQATSSPIQIE